MENQPLVSIVVITYNSSKYVLETLESAKAQTYQNIELIVTDDCSTDNTVEICREWIDSNKDRFVRTELITVQQNTGVSPNCNRGYRAAQGEWIKGIAGDDILLSNCVTDNINYVNKHTEIQILFSNMIFFKCKEGKRIILKKKQIKDKQLFYQKGAKEQNEILHYDNFNFAPTCIMKNNLYGKYQFNETYKMIEDHPLWFNITRNGIKLHYINRNTVMYRMSSSVTRPSNFLFNEKFVESFRLFYLLEIKDNLTCNSCKPNKKFQRFLLHYDFMSFFFNNKRTFFSRIVTKILVLISK